MEQHKGTPGGARLRALRRRAGKTQLAVELEAGLGSGYLQRVESGKVAQPQRATLERILDAIEADARESSIVLELFGYTALKPLPTRKEIAWAKALCQRDLQETQLPAYLLDCAHRLLAWNRSIPKLLGITPDDPELMRLAHTSLIDEWFDPHSRLGALVHDPAHFYPQQVRALQHEMRPFRNEAWCRQLIAHWLRDLPLFNAYWTAREQARDHHAGATRVVSPTALHGPDRMLLQFRLTTEPFTQDVRFRILYYVPADPDTMRLCAAWAQRQGNTDTD